MGFITEADFAYAVECRRRLHRYPELLFALDRTAAFVRGELEQMGIAPGEAGPGSVTGYIGPADARTTVALRADMDALPIEERTGLPYASRIPGAMHACGHDAHTAVLLTAARVLKRREAALNVRVKLLFQPSEEGAESGAKSMASHGALKDADLVAAAHCDNELEAGTVGICPGPYMTASTLIDFTFLGRRAHTAMPEQGADAVAMAAEAYGALKRAAAQEAGGRPYIFGINVVQGGTAPNMIADRCGMTAAFRWYDADFCERFRARCEAECREIAARYGGSSEQVWRTSAPPVINDPALTARFIDSTERALGHKPVILSPSRLSEDFSWFLREKPGFLFRFGTRNEALGCTAPLHSDTFRLDERGMESAAAAFVSFVTELE